MLRVIPGIGRELAERIFDTLHVNNYEALENALHSGQLSKVPGIGKNRLQTIGTWLLNLMPQHHTEAKHQQDQRDSHRDSPKAANRKPSIQTILKLDQVYRQKTKDGQLPLISPKRFNPDNKAWLPIMHKTDDEWHFTALFSNTERAHKLNRVFDWVVIYAYDSQHHESQYTVVTETTGKLLGKRVIRGKEKECLRYYISTGEEPE
jgi:putative hydrolase